MAEKIKTRQVHKDIKALDKTVIATERMKRAYVRTKEGAEQTQIQGQEHATPVEYAENKIGNAADKAAHETAHQVRKQGGKLVHVVKEKHRVSKETKQIKQQIREERPSASGEAFASSSAGRERPFHQPKEHMKKQAGTQQRTVQAKKLSVQTVKNAGSSKKMVKTTHKAEKTVKSTGKGTVKTAGKTVKTAERSAKTTIKTTEQTAKTAQAAAKASAKAAQKSAQAARAAAKATATTIKAAIKAVITTVKAIIAGTKALISAIAAGGWVAVVVLLLICMIGLLLSSSFGIFFSGESVESGQQTMQTIVAEINAEYQGKLDEIKNGTSYDVVEMSGSRAVWREVLAVYAVKVNTDPDNPQEVATIDDNKKQLLNDIFWEMHTISSSTGSVTETVTEEFDDGHGNIVTTESTVTRTHLYITVSHKTADEMAKQYGFNEEQKALLKELLSEEYASIWSSVLYGISAGDGEIVAVAASQIGNVGGEPCWSWYGFGSRVEWCACFVSWCSDQCGYIDTGIIPKFSLCTDGAMWFKNREQWQDGSYTPSAGDIIFFDWNGDGETDHVGIVEKTEGNMVYTIEGNSEDSCKQKSYMIGSTSIYGYGIPAY